jgi:hypothetical protein
MVERYPPHRSGYGRASSDRPIPDDRARTARARQAAEALFAPKPPVTELVAGRDPPADQSARQRRVLETSSPVPVRPEVVEAPVSPVIPTAHFARIRTWVRYGMAVAQVAQVYGVPVREVERVLGKT